MKSLLLRTGPDDYLLALVPGDRSLDWPKVRRALGVNRVTLPDAEEAFRATGYRRGTITPLGCSPTRRVLLDASVVGRRIGLGSGVAGRSALVYADALVRAYDAVVADISASP
ncbi:aminoacyl-tRNA deacylase [Mycetocola reblochoni]|uniref:aminoacyl-tRNA deacylase n=1 Tax=Mycetocola reblochoni TaxID=331618 RepID=UPI003F98FF64